jgi:transcriptional regulator with XRE-family HTH domain
MTTPHPNDVLVGANIRLRRQAAHISQIKLGEHLGVTFQQVQKYEKGTNRVGAGRLLIIAELLKVSVVTFYDGAKMSGHRSSPIRLLNQPDAFKLAEAFSKISNKRTRNALVALVQGLSYE